MVERRERRMNMQSRNKTEDVLKDLFGQLPTEQLPEGFREHLMQRVLREAVRMQRKKERIGLLTVIAGAVCMLLVGFTCTYLYQANMEQVSGLFDAGLFGYATSLMKSSYGSFFIYVGILALLLLMADTWLRKQFFKRRTDQEEESVKYES